MVRPPFLARVIAVMSVLISVLFFAAAAIIFLSSGVVYQGLQNAFGGVFADVLGFIGVFFVLVGILYSVIGIGLWRGRGWARITLVFMSGVWLVFSTVSVLSGDLFSLVGCALHGFVIWYFTRKNVRAAYR